MKTITIISILATALLLAGCATSNPEVQDKTCYRTAHSKTPYRVAIPCPSAEMPAPVQK